MRARYDIDYYLQAQSQNASDDSTNRPRKKITDKVDFAVGFTKILKVGDQIKEGDCLCLIHHNNSDIADVMKDVLDAFIIGEEKPEHRPMVVERVT